MTYKDAWEAIQFKHCEDTCDFGMREDCQGDKCEYYLALIALNKQYYAEQTEPTSYADGYHDGQMDERARWEKQTEPKCEDCKHYNEEVESIACERCLDGKYSRYELTTEESSMVEDLGVPYVEYDGKELTDCSWK